MKRKIALALAVLMVITALAGCKPAEASKPQASASSAASGASSSTPVKADAVTIKFAIDDTKASTYYMGLEAFKKEVEEKTGGGIKVEIYADAQLGSAKDTIEGLQYGTIECCFTSTAAMSNFVPEYAVVDAPFMFRDAKHADAVMDGEVGQNLSAKMLEKQNIRVMGYMDTGYRHMYSKKPVNSLADFKGLKIRTMTSEVHVATFEALGAIPTPMAAGEVFTALQQNTIDAAENAYSYVVNQKMYEAIDYLIESGHFYAFCAIMISENFYKSLSAEYQQIVLEAGKNACTYQREAMTKQNEEAKAKLIDLGIKIIEIDREELKKAVQPVYEKYSSLIDPATVAKINAM